jgi:RimJ/RimL family protein N-acetyltransferase
MTAGFEARPWERAPAGAAAERATLIAGAIPVLETPRLRLRGPRIEDYPIYSGFVRDDRGAGLRKGRRDRASWLDFCEMIAGWTLRGIGPWTMETRGGEAVGVLVINHEYGDPELEIGWLVTPEAEGRGFATETARAALDWAFGAQGLRTLVSYVSEDNARSIRVAERLGAIRDTGVEAGLGCRVYRHQRREAVQ